MNKMVIANKAGISMSITTNPTVIPAVGHAIKDTHFKKFGLSEIARVSSVVWELGERDVTIWVYVK